MRCMCRMDGPVGETGAVSNTHASLSSLHQVSLNDTVLGVDLTSRKYLMEVSISTVCRTEISSLHLGARGGISLFSQMASQQQI